MSKEEKNIEVPESNKKLSNEDFELNESDTKIMRLVLDYKCLTNKQIGDIVGMTPKQISVIRNKPIFKKVYNEYQKKAIDIIISAKTEAAIKLKKHIHSKNEKISQDTCKAILSDELKEKETERKPIEVIFKFE